MFYDKTRVGRRARAGQRAIAKRVAVDPSDQLKLAVIMYELSYNFIVYLDKTGLFSINIVVLISGCNFTSFHEKLNDVYK